MGLSKVSLGMTLVVVVALVMLQTSKGYKVENSLHEVECRLVTECGRI